MGTESIHANQLIFLTNPGKGDPKMIPRLIPDHTEATAAAQGHPRRLAKSPASHKQIRMLGVDITYRHTSNHTFIAYSNL
ncbi:hypothetical protein VDQ16_20915 [Xanthomonas campestris pv. campestris]|uniref:hypothetical protein n=1 Tax=Xanthomonas campestris TaxID=339 RepID=UPI0023799C26|nr:hypothetical protein [Xanthomonas campestris]MEB1262449.1 hypothetical protein [Xanthomonas campestris pv. campestris]MEB1324756.1 hypothetical protein [Xanthomonas campestris pv. campestris]MEB1358253.1 hypothetical protein [Xanthomonas campestris pv. campestris]MEB1424236.1 hypothetical protein [Xanthomonas campestris pv. campestris]MEB1449171.1 hypothetical protein [Xanthomonas campestris pv. campestris]